MKKNWIKKTVAALSFTTALFIFQACYGTPQDFGADVYIEGTVTDKATGEPVEGIKVSIDNSLQYVYTAADGSYSFYVERTDTIVMHFEDSDTTANGSYITKDTSLTDYPDELTFSVALETAE